MLLDFDGVVFRSKPANKLLQTRCENFVRAHVHYPDCAPKLNTMFYYEHGHTLIGLNNCLQTKRTVDNFNSFVYDDIDYYSLCKELSENEFNKDLLDTCNAKYDCYLFSNARRDWITNICNLYGYSLKNQKILDVSNYFLKPEFEAYQLAEEFMGSEKYDTITFVDDSELNIKNAPRAWNKIIYR